MALQIGNREKLAGLSIVGLVTIGLMHYFLFMDKAHSYNTAFERYQAARSKYMNTVIESQRPKIMQFISANQDMEAFLHSLMSDLGVDWPPVFFPEEGDEAVKKRQARFLELVNQTVDLRKSHPKIKLPFLDWNDGEGWDIPAALPSNAMPPLLWDHIETLRVAAMELRVLQDPIARANKRLEYNRYLSQIGVDANRLLPQMPGVKTVANHGPLVPLIKRLAHARLIWEQKVQEEKRGNAARVPIKTKEELYNLLEIELPKDPELLFYAIKQLEFLQKLVSLAEAKGVEEIRAVKLMPVRKVDDVPAGDPQDPTKRLMVPEIYPEVPLGAMAGGAWRRPWGGMRPPQMGARNPYAVESPAERRYNVNPEEENDMAVAPTLPSQRAPVTGQPTKPEEYDPLKEAVVPTAIPIASGSWMGDVTPIQIAVFATWETTLEFLYALHHNHNPFEIDSLLMKTRPGEGGRITTAVTLVPMANVMGLKEIFAPTTATLAANRPRRPVIGGGMGAP